MNLTFKKIEGRDWLNDIPDSDDSFVLRKAYELHTKKLIDFTPDDIRFCLGQQYQLDYIVPLSLSILEEDLFTKTDYYAGSLLENTLKIKSDYWVMNPSQKDQLIALCAGSIRRLDSIELIDEIKDEIRTLFEVLLHS